MDGWGGREGGREGGRGGERGEGNVRRFHLSSSVPCSTCYQLKPFDGSTCQQRSLAKEAGETSEPSTISLSPLTGPGGVQAVPEAVPQVFQKHLEAALADARPSVPPAERKRLEGIYSRFLQSRDPGIGNASASSKGKGKRATLA
jgi:hypothetical protein